MGIMLAFAPFIVFAVLDRYLGSTGALVAGAVISGALIARSWMKPGHPVRILEIGTFILMLLLAIYTATAGSALSVIGVRLCADTGLLLIVLISMALRRPFTMEYARDQVAAEYWNSPRFIKINYVLTAGWAVAFAAMVVAEIGILFIPGLPTSIGVGAVVAAILGGFAFTDWYPKHVKHDG
jgi:hypothetical protein